MCELVPRGRRGSSSLCEGGKKKKKGEKASAAIPPPFPFLLRLGAAITRRGGREDGLGEKRKEDSPSNPDLDSEAWEEAAAAAAAAETGLSSLVGEGGRERRRLCRGGGSIAVHI